MTTSAYIEMDAVIHSPYLVAHGNQNAYHIKTFYFYSAAWAWYLSYFLVRSPLTAVTILSLLVQLYCRPAPEMGATAPCTLLSLEDLLLLLWVSGIA